MQSRVATAAAVVVIVLIGRRQKQLFIEIV